MDKEIAELIEQVQKYSRKSAGELLLPAFHLVEKLTLQMGHLSFDYPNFALNVCKTLCSLQAPERYLAASTIGYPDHFNLSDETRLRQIENAEVLGLSKVLELSKNVKAAHRALFNDLEQHHNVILNRLDSITDDFGIWAILVAQQVQLMHELYRYLKSQNLVAKPKDQFIQETRLIAIPVAEQLGIRCLRAMLEELSLACLKPANHNRIKQMVAELEDRDLMAKHAHALNTMLVGEGIKAQGQIHPRTIASIDQFLTHNPKVAESRPHKLFKFFFIVSNEHECYAAKSVFEKLATVRSVSLTSTDAYEDFIRDPKPNGYQGLHLTVTLDEDTSIAVRLYTQEMLSVANYGVTAQWRGISVVRKSTTPPILPDQVLVFTRSGDPRYLPSNATVLDFAYHIHSEVGHHTVGARVNGVGIHISRPLRNGDLVEIVTSKDGSPSLHWLKHVRTPLAKSFVRKWLLLNRRLDVTQDGRRLLRRQLQRIPRLIADDEIFHALTRLDLPRYGTLQDFLARVGVGDVNLKSLISDLAKHFGHPLIAVKTDSSLPVVIAQCCNPLVGDSIVGRETSNKIQIHRMDCKNLGVDTRYVPCEWREDLPYIHDVSVTIKANDRVGLLLDVLEPITSRSVNMSDVKAMAMENRDAVVSIIASVASEKQLTEMISDLGNVRGVTSVEINKDGLLPPIIINPYSPSRPVQTERLFFGREMELETTLNRLFGLDANNTLLVAGQKRIGKSSFLYHIQRNIINSGTLPVFVDLQADITGDDTALLFHLGKSITKSLRREGEILSSPSAADLERHPLLRFSYFLDELEGILGKRRIVIMLDEFQVLIESVNQGVLTEKTLLFLRDIVQHRVGASFVFAYTGPLVRFSAEPIPNQIFDVSTVVKLSYLTNEEATSLVREPVRDRLNFDVEATELLVAATNGHPWYLQNLCSSLFAQKKGRGKVRVGDVRSSLDRWSSNVTSVPSSHFSQLGNEVTSKLILAAIAEARSEGIPIEDLKERLAQYSSQDDIERYLTELEDIDVVHISESAHVSIRVPILYEWIKRRMPLRRVLREFGEDKK